MEGKINILVVDDDPIELEIIKFHFDKGGIRNYEMFTDVEEFFKHFNDEVYLAVCDYQLAGTTAVAVADRIKELCKCRESITSCEIIIISGTEDIRVPVYFFNERKSDYFILKDTAGECYLELVVYAQKAIEHQRQLEKEGKRLDGKKQFYESLTIADERK